MKIECTILLEELRQLSVKNIHSIEQFSSLSESQLNFKTSPDSWSILECLDHLNRYGDFYLKEIENRILQAEESPKASLFTSGWLGNYFVNMMLPKNGEIKKMKTKQEMNPINSDLPVTTVNRFLKQQYRFLELLKMSKKVDLKRVKTAVSFTGILKLRLGDILRFNVFHNRRHVEQALRVPYPQKTQIERTQKGCSLSKAAQ